MAQRLKRKFNNETYYCEKIVKTKSEAKKGQQSFKKAGFKARVVKLSEDGRTVYGVFAR